MLKVIAKTAKRCFDHCLIWDYSYRRSCSHQRISSSVVWELAELFNLSAVWYSIGFGSLFGSLCWMLNSKSEWLCLDVSLSADVYTYLMSGKHFIRLSGWNCFISPVLNCWDSLLYKLQAAKVAYNESSISSNASKTLKERGGNIMLTKTPINDPRITKGSMTITMP